MYDKEIWHVLEVVWRSRGYDIIPVCLTGNWKTFVENFLILPTYSLQDWLQDDWHEVSVDFVRFFLCVRRMGQQVFFEHHQSENPRITTGSQTGHYDWNQYLLSTCTVFPRSLRVSNWDDLWRLQSRLQREQCLRQNKVPEEHLL